LFYFMALTAFAQNASVVSPNNKWKVDLKNDQSATTGKWYLNINSLNGNTEIIPKIDLGIIRSDQDFSKELKFIKADKPKFIQERYTALHGKSSERSNSGNEVVLYFENPSKAKLNVIVRAYNDGVTFRYEFPEKTGTFTIKDELTAYKIPDSTARWLEKFDLSNEGLYSQMKDASVQQDWCYPALFNVKDNPTWYLIHEADLDRNYAATKLDNRITNSEYKVTLPGPDEGVGEPLPIINLPWKSPWRVIIMGTLAEVVESNLVQDVSSPSVITDTDWIKPGV